MQFWKPRGNVFVRKSEIFGPMFQDGQFFSLSFLFQNFFCTLKMFWRTNRRQFWQPRWNFSDERPKNFLYVQKIINKNVKLLKIHFLPQMFLCTHIHCIFDILNQELWQKAKIFAQCPKLFINHSFFNKIFSSKCFFGHIESVFDTSSRNDFDEKMKIFLHCPKKYKVCFPVNLFSSNFKLILWTRRKMFRQPCADSYQEAENFCLLVSN